MKSIHPVWRGVAPLAVIALLLAVLSVPLAEAQQPAPPKYAMLEFMKIEPGKRDDYLKMERELWMPIHRERLKAGTIKSWSLWSRRFPGGTGYEYDTICITTFDKFTDVETSYPPEVYTRAHPKMTANERNARTVATRNMVRTEFVQLLDHTQMTAANTTPKYAYIGYMKHAPGKGYVNLEGRYWKPIHQERVNRGILRSWALFQVRLPGGSNKEYSFFTIQLLDDFQHLENQYPAGIWEKVHPNVKQTEIDERTNVARQMVRTDLLTLVEQVR
jgi:hypothetical protein